MINLLILILSLEVVQLDANCFYEDFLGKRLVWCNEITPTPTPEPTKQGE